MGWREWIELPELGVSRIKAKVDTGARSSSLHAEDIELFQLRGEVGVRFVVLPLQRSRLRPVPCQAPLYDERYVKSSNGSRELRPVIRTAVRWGGQVWEVDVTLTSRDLMGFRMLLGREAIRRRFLVDTGRSYFGGRAIAAAQPLPSLVPAMIPGAAPAVVAPVARAPVKKKRRGGA
jgi:hypothetical protein